MSEIDVYGFDYDYTLVNYTDELAYFIFDTTIDYLVSRLKVSIISLFSCEFSIQLSFGRSGMIRTSSFVDCIMTSRR